LKQRSDFELLNTTRVNVKSFDCGKKPINDYLHKYADKNMGLGLSVTFILPYKKEGDAADAKHRVAAFYTLANQTLSPETIPTEKKLPRYQAPVVLVAQLGVNKSHQGQGLGIRTLITALLHAYSVSTAPNAIPSLGVVVDAIDDDAYNFYMAMDFFIPFAGVPLKLFVPMESISQLADVYFNS
jgi:GNAT superfamily N-acetyltransferase